MPASKEQQWKPEEDNILRKITEDGLTFDQMLEHLPNRTRRAINSRMYLLKLKYKHSNLKYSILIFFTIIIVIFLTNKSVVK
jgi:hypothetical protein